MRIAITGSTGYVGGRLTAHLAASGQHDLVIATRGDASRIQPLFGDDGRVVTCKFDDSESIRDLLTGADAIIHLASPNEIASAEHPGRALMDTALITSRLVRGSERVGLSRFIYFSTAHVYRAPLVGRIDELTLTAPTHPYSIAHRAAEDWVLASSLKGSLCGTVVRLSNSIGAPRWAEVDRWTLLVNDLCRQAVEHGKLTLRSPGLDQRDFVTMSDVCRAVSWLLDMDETRASGIWNVGAGKSERVIDMARRIAGRARIILGFEPEIVRPEANGPKPDPLEYNVDKLKTSGFQLENDFDRAVDETLELCREAFGAGKK